MRFIICILFIIISLGSCIHRKQIILPANNRIILTVAKQETLKVIDKIPPGNESNYGFLSREEFDKIKTTDPFSFFTIENDVLIQDPSFFVPILINNEYRAIARVEKTGNSFQLTDFGSSNLAKEIQPHIIRNKASKFIGILRIHHLYSDYLIFSKNRNYFYIPLQSAQKSLYKYGFNENKSTYVFEEIINHINAVK